MISILLLTLVLFVVLSLVSLGVRLGCLFNKRFFLFPEVSLYCYKLPSNLKRYMHPIFIAALFTIAKTRKQTKCPSTDEWIKKMWYIYTMEYYSAIKKE